MTDHFPIKKWVEMALMVATASIIFSLESMVPTPVPGLRLGLANLMTLLAIRWWGLREGMAVLILRVFLGGLLSGRLFQPVFFMSLTGGLISAIGMGLLMGMNERWLSLVGISIFGAVLKNLTQLVVAYGFFVRQISIFMMFPFSILLGLATGLIIGLLAVLLHGRLMPLMQSQSYSGSSSISYSA